MKQAAELHAGFLLVFNRHFDPQNVGEMFFRNFGWLSTGYTELSQKRELFKWIQPVPSQCFFILVLSQEVPTSETSSGSAMSRRANGDWIKLQSTWTADMVWSVQTCTESEVTMTDLNKLDVADTGGRMSISPASHTPSTGFSALFFWVHVLRFLRHSFRVCPQFYDYFCITCTIPRQTFVIKNNQYEKNLLYKLTVAKVLNKFPTF
jgi:hypothetical protein